MLENTTFRTPDPFPPSSEGRETTTLWSPLEKANLKHWTKMETDPVSGT
jgi:hypothetical protein